MIAFVRGAVVSASADRVIVDIGPVGIETICTPATALSLRTGDQVELLTSVIVREDGWTVYGFLDADEKHTFEQVQTVTGVGPRIALGLLSTLAPDELRVAVLREDKATLTKVPGIGPKAAARLVLELKDKLGAPTGGIGVEQPPAVADGWRATVAAGLLSLGWSQKDADAAVAAVEAQATDLTVNDEPDVAALLKAALRSLA